MKVTEITKPMFLLNEQELEAATGQVRLGMHNHKKKNYESAVACFLAAAKLGHPVAQYVLGLYYESGIGVSKDAHMAFQLYLEAARHGHVDAQRLVGLRYLDGQGTQRDIATGLAWMEMAGQAGDSKACERLIQLYEQTNLQDREKAAFWRTRLKENANQNPLTSRSGGTGAAKAMPTLGSQAERFQRTEYYGNSSGMDKPAGVVQGTLYYLSYMSGQLCASNLDGSNAKVLAHLEQYLEACMAATSDGIYLYKTAENNRESVFLRVAKVALDGSAIKEFRLEADEWSAKSVYICAPRLFYVLHKNGKCYLCSFDTETGQRSVLYRRATEIMEVYGGIDYVVFHAKYENGSLSENGWMRYDLDTGEVRCLDCSLSPENVLDHPQYYNDESPSYVEDVHSWDIAFFDMPREILWVEHTEQENQSDSLVAHSLSVKGMPRCPEIPVWHLHPKALSPVQCRGNIYFDGERMYYAPHYSRFCSFDREGNMCDWNFQNGGHGCCQKFFVLGDLLFLDGDARGEKVYPARTYQTEPQMDSWLNKVPAPIPAARPKPEPAARLTATAPGGQHDLETSKTLTATDEKYGILTFGSKFHVGFGVPVTVMVNGRQYSGKMHNSSKGRVDGVKRIMSEQGLREGSLVHATYDAKQRLIRLDILAVD